ncbi:squalene/phytoene synthase family protein [Glycomyces scopariae]|uniref:Phytoene/squalene synthetase n=1 Tax=Glycomyces sambucus TaxID=380244 RepID=A0A1G9I2Z9_9ACTN|nr:squalene/phytoene synthase family protein [Glycomyces sambucus]SDL19627.1 Phytoene/squalene synthetase [Glycomyces sambucus]
MNDDQGLALYHRTARRAAAEVIAGYSTSFGLACRILGPRVRDHVRDVYALVRVADEIVDGPAAEAGLDAAATRYALDDLERHTLLAIDEGFSANLVVHAFALTARECGIGADLVRPFFASMRSDLDVTDHDERSRTQYVYGSAEVVGLMCLQVFVNAERPGTDPADPLIREGARRLGSAFQEINFLRDADHDRTSLGRDYLGVGDSAEAKASVLDRIDRDLLAAKACIPLLPKDCRRAVATAHGLFAALSRRLREEDTGSRVRISNWRKAVIAARASLVPVQRGGAA